MKKITNKQKILIQINNKPKIENFKNIININNKLNKNIFLPFILERDNMGRLI